MKTKGPGGPAPPPVEETKTTETTAARGSPPAGLASKLDRAARASGSEPSQAARWTPAPAPLRAVAADLRSGKIDVVQAAERIIDDVVSRRVGAALPASAQSTLRALLGELAARDPSLAARVARLAKLK